jgi:hypothetical protein
MWKNKEPVQKIRIKRIRRRTRGKKVSGNKKMTANQSQLMDRRNLICRTGMTALRKFSLNRRILSRKEITNATFVIKNPVNLANGYFPSLDSTSSFLRESGIFPAL